MKPGNKNQMLGTLDDFKFVVEYASITSRHSLCNLIMNGEE